MDHPLNPTNEARLCRPRGPIRAWVPLTLIAAILVAACAAANVMPDTRTFAERHGSVTRSTAL